MTVPITEIKFNFVYKLKDSPHPHVPLMLGLLNTNSDASFDSTKSISVPKIFVNRLRLIDITS